MTPARTCQEITWKQRLHDLELNQEAFMVTQARLEAKVAALGDLLQSPSRSNLEMLAELKERLRLSEGHAASFKQSLRRLEGGLKAN